MDWFSALISTVGTVLVAIVGGLFARERKKAAANQERFDRRSELRAKEGRMMMDLMVTNNAVTMVVAKKVLGMHTNGDVEAALKDFDQVQKEYNKFILDAAAENVTNSQ